MRFKPETWHPAYKVLFAPECSVPHCERTWAPWMISSKKSNQSRWLCAEHAQELPPELQEDRTKTCYGIKTCKRKGLSLD